MCHICNFQAPTTMFGVRDDRPLCADCYWDERDLSHREFRENRHKLFKKKLYTVINEAVDNPVGDLIMILKVNPHITPKMIVEKMSVAYPAVKVEEFMELPLGDERMAFLCDAFAKVQIDKMGSK